MALVGKTIQEPPLAVLVASIRDLPAETTLEVVEQLKTMGALQGLDQALQLEPWGKEDKEDNAE